MKQPDMVVLIELDDRVSSALKALDLVTRYADLAADAKPARGRMVRCLDARKRDGSAFDYNLRGYDFTTCYSRARDANRERDMAAEIAAVSCGGGLLPPGGAPEDEWCSGCRENEQIWHAHRAAIRERGIIKRQMCALGRRVRRGGANAS